MTTVPLTTVARAKAYFMSSTPEVVSADDLIARIIRAASVFVPGYLGWTGIAEREVRELRDGEGGTAMLLREAPVLSIDSLSILGTAVPADSCLLSPIRNAELQTLNLVGRAFPRQAPMAVNVVYRAGFVQTDPYTVEAGVTFTPAGLWIADGGVTYVSGGTGALHKVAEDPAQGEYAVDADGVYTFSDDDADAELYVRYSVVPDDIEEVVIELVGDWFKRRDRIGQTSQTIGTQTIGFSQRDIPSNLLAILNRYKRVAPI